MNKILPTAIALLIAAGSALASPDYYLTGSFNGWTPNQAAFKFTEEGDIYTLKVASLSGDFKVTTPNWEHQFGAASPLEYGETYKCIESGNAYNMVLAEGTGSDLTITFDDSNKTIRVDAAATIYLVGDFNGWLPSPAYSFTESDGKYVLRTDSFTGPFKIVSATGSISLGAPSGLGVLAPNVEVLMEEGGGSLNFSGLPGGSGKIRITIVADSKANSVAAPGADCNEEERTEYFTLQGIRVAEPGPGLYIRRTGSHAEKVLIR